MGVEPTTMRELRESIVIDGQPDEIFTYFTDAEAMVEWMGQAASLDPRPGGELAIEINNSSVRGHYELVDPPRRLVFTWGFLDSGALPPDASRVEILLTKEAGGTRVDLIHRGLTEAEFGKHAHGWRHFLAQLARVRGHSITS